MGGRSNDTFNDDLVLVSDSDPGIRRKRAGKGFQYLKPNGKPVKDRATLKRIRALAIPPAWREVWICVDANGHIQATGRDAKQRKQYRYHERWNERSGQSKFERMLAFGESLPAIREQVEGDLKREGLPYEKVLALVIKLLETTLIRVGNTEYLRQNGSFGLTTLRDRHVSFKPSSANLRFQGKSGVKHAIDISDRRLIKLIKQVRDVPGRELFQYVDEDGQRHPVTSADVNGYLREIMGEEFSAKDFRTWGGTIYALRLLLTAPPCSNQTQQKREISKAVRIVAENLGNTVTVCRKYYIHPAILDAYSEGKLTDLVLGNGNGKRSRKIGAEDIETDELEKTLLKFLKKLSNTN
ncbi:MAG: DNA topoisomerase IB [Anaerolineae bacterium]|nr:DNA topoisomerase IB [Anaerolineae bacterium]